MSCCSRWRGCAAWSRAASPTTLSASSQPRDATRTARSPHVASASRSQISSLSASPCPPTRASTSSPTRCGSALAMPRSISAYSRTIPRAAAARSLRRTCRHSQTQCSSSWARSSASRSPPRGAARGCLPNIACACPSCSRGAPSSRLRPRSSMSTTRCTCSASGFAPSTRCQTAASKAHCSTSRNGKRRGPGRAATMPVAALTAWRLSPIHSTTGATRHAQSTSRRRPMGFAFCPTQSETAVRCAGSVARRLTRCHLTPLPTRASRAPHPAKRLPARRALRPRSSEAQTPIQLIPHSDMSERAFARGGDASI
mmetsp:Transcript_27871/g.71169  ORF Transcript_27871/g.71169 Transcript_27871/m.71169 type:complete len:313 (-) Transcript_27871:584-1522(-)